MKYLIPILFLYVALARGHNNGSIVTHGLHEHGEHVCFTMGTYYRKVDVTVREQTLKVVYYMTGWIHKVKKSRMQAVTVIRHMKVTKEAKRKILDCCSGWMRKHHHSTECLQPTCGIPCQHGGTCVAPNKCKCVGGYDGPFCGHVINDCDYKERNDCEQVCTATMPGHECSCRLGWKLKRDQKHCRDVNECKRTRAPCQCRKEDGVCKAICENTPGSYRCKCNKGYRVTSAEQCEDIDECVVHPGICDQVCVNKPGTYNCNCWSGFSKNKSTDKCEDIDECKDHKGGCSDTCHNVIGSYVCTCPPGFYLGPDRKTCHATKPTMRNKVICQTDILGELNCDSYEEKIMIIDAMYGRLTKEYCQFGNYTQDVRCLDRDNPMKYLKATCDNQSTCVIFLEEKVFGDPCPGIEKYMQVTYDCMK